MICMQIGHSMSLSASPMVTSTSASDGGAEVESGQGSALTVGTRAPTELSPPILRFGPSLEWMFRDSYASKEDIFGRVDFGNGLVLFAFFW